MIAPTVYGIHLGVFAPGDKINAIAENMSVKTNAIGNSQKPTNSSGATNVTKHHLKLLQGIP